MVKKDILVVRLERLREYLKTLKVLQTYNAERFVDDVFAYAAAERYLQLSIECLLDIGNHIIADLNYSKPETYADIFRILAENKIIPSKLYRELEGVTGFRNILVHDYLAIDRAQVYRVLQQKLAVLEKLGTTFSKLL